jgi:broad-specificity NMP kinase
MIIIINRIIIFQEIIFQEEIINEIVIKHECNKKPNKQLGKQTSFYFDEKKDKKILNEYNNKNKNIMMISDNINIRPWEVVSVLMKHKVIAKRVEARGYDLYKETDEYKDKITK